MSQAVVPGFECLRHQNQWIWWNAALVDGLEPCHFDLQAWQTQGGAEPAAGRGSACRIQQGGADWFLRHYRRGGLIGKLLHDQYWWSGLANTRIVREMMVTGQLAERGLPVPNVVGGRVQRSGLIYRCDLITQALPVSASMAERLGELTQEQWTNIGKVIAAVHAEGVWHADLNAHNILLDNDGGAWIIDFDRAQFRPPDQKWQQANLNRLWRSVCKISGGEDNAPQEQWQHLLVAYNS
ncbi:MAG: 3-deoxy-D-manno-octulosonic acid kinase [Gammaproteobacteria bacterium]|nr:3-deoxy-D-manno-octulosonic acid kinase [Gammaproteobacteria bacterium]